MPKEKKTVLEVNGTTVAVIAGSAPSADYISLTDIARHRDAVRTDYLIMNWLRNRQTVEFLGIWERLNNPDFNPIEFDGIRSRAGLNSFILTARQWTERTGAVGLVSKPGRYGGTFAHRDIAFEFATWISVEFKLYLIREFQRLKEDESRRIASPWNLHRTLAKVNYRIHTDAVKSRLIPATVTPERVAATYASEADLLNVALFGRTAKEWRTGRPGAAGNLRDHATIEQLLVLSNLEGLNAEFIGMGLSPRDRLVRLNETAIRQMRILGGTGEVLRRLG